MASLISAIVNSLRSGSPFKASIKAPRKLALMGSNFGTVEGKGLALASSRSDSQEVGAMLNPTGMIREVCLSILSGQSLVSSS